MKALTLRRIGGLISSSRNPKTTSSSSSILFSASRTVTTKGATSSYHRPPTKFEGRDRERLNDIQDDDDVINSGISRPLVDALRELNKKVPDTFVKVRKEDGFDVKYIPWHIVNRILNLHVPEWSGEVRNITYAPDGKSVSVVYRVTLYGTDAEVYRESTGTASMDDTSYGDPVQKAEAMAFRRACARLGLGLHLYHEDMM